MKLKRYCILEYEKSCYLSQIISFYFTRTYSKQSGRCLSDCLAWYHNSHYLYYCNFLIKFLGYHNIINNYVVKVHSIICFAMSV